MIEEKGMRNPFRQKPEKSSVSRITINGKTFEASGNNVVIQNGVVTVEEGLAMRLPQKQGQQVQYTAHGRTLVVKRTPNRSFFLKIVGSQYGRWADFATDARHDIQYFLDTGALPRSRVMY